MIDFKKLTIIEARKLLTSGALTARVLAEHYLAEIASKNKDINAYLEVYADVLEQADVADARIKAGEDAPLLGIPLAIKDNILIKGRKASAASKMLENYTAVYDATAIEKLKKAGAVFIGRTNMDEFAMGGSTENSAFGATKNPHDTSRVPGGSSGGSAAALAMDGALGALGSDTGGSIRQPASFCGLVGLKPTYGAVSRHGLMAMGSSLDQIGPFAKTVSDAEVIFDVIRGKDALDSTSVSGEEYPQKKVGKKLRIGVPRDLLSMKGISKEVLENIEASIERFKKLGHTIVDISLPNAGYSLAVYYILMPAEVSSNLARFDGVKYGLHVDGKDLKEDYFKTRRVGFGKEVRRRILLGTYVLSAGYYDAYYNKAQKVRSLIISDFEKAWKDVDLVLTPTAPTPAFKIGEKTSDPLEMYLADVFTVTANIAGIPAISIPSGFSGKLPLGIQLMAPMAGEDILFKAGKDFLGEV